MRYYREQAELQTVFEGPPRLTYLYTHSHLRTAKSNHPPSLTLAGLWNGFTVVVCNLVHRLEQQSSVMLFFYIDFDILDWWDGEIRFLYLYTSTDLVNVYTLALAWRSGFPLKNTNRRIPTKRPNLPPIPIISFRNGLMLFNHPCHHPFYGVVHYPPLQTRNFGSETGFRFTDLWEELWDVAPDGIVRGSASACLRYPLHPRSPQRAGSLLNPPPHVTKYSGGTGAN